MVDSLVKWAGILVHTRVERRKYKGLLFKNMKLLFAKVTFVINSDSNSDPYFSIISIVICGFTLFKGPQIVKTLINKTRNNEGHL